MITRFSIFKIILSICLLNLSLAQDEEEQRGVSPSQDLYIAFDQTSGNTNNLVTGAEYSFALVGDIASLKDTEFSFSLGGNYATLEDVPYALDGMYITI